LVMQYAQNGDLTNYLTNNNSNITWERRLEILYGVATGLSQIHEKNLIHCNLHSGNVLINAYMTLIGDLGICPPNKEKLLDSKYGVLPYVAPELLLQNNSYMTAVDVYSFGSIMWELATGQKPFIDRLNDNKLSNDICNGLRPEINDNIHNIPECYSKLIQRCWNHDPLNRPSIDEL
ncbi:kinase-like domain-containing protein, partial [Gigaspora rosea]